MASLSFELYPRLQIIKNLRRSIDLLCWLYTKFTASNSLLVGNSLVKIFLSFCCPVSDPFSCIAIFNLWSKDWFPFLTKKKKVPDICFLNFHCSESIIIWLRCGQSDSPAANFEPNFNPKHQETPANVLMENSWMEKTKQNKTQWP